MRTVISNATIVTMNAKREIIPNGMIVIEDDRITIVGTSEALPEAIRNTDIFLDASGCAVFPGLINTHVHSFQTLLRGLETDSDLDAWLKRIISPSVTAITPEDAYLGAILSGLDGIHSGTTTMVDYQYAQYLEALNGSAIAGYRDLGIRLVHARGFADTGVQFGANPNEIEHVDAIFDSIDRLLSDYANDPMVTIALAPSAIWMCTPELLQATSTYATMHNLMVTAHIAETAYDNACSTTLHGQGDFKTCQRYGLINNRMLMVHGVTLSKQEISEAAESNAALSYNPVSNMYLASGAAPINWVQEYNLTGSLGTDGAASNNTNDMLETLKAAVLFAKGHFQQPNMFSAVESLEFATISGAKAIGMEEELGSLEAGKKADLFVYNPSLSSKSVPFHDPVASLVYSSDSRNVEMVMIDGKVVLRHSRLVGMDESKMLDRAAVCARNLVSRINRP